MRVLTTVIGAAACVAAAAVGTAAYQSVASSTPADPPVATSTSSPGGVEVVTRLAPCPRGTAPERRSCVRKVVRTVTVVDPPALPPAIDRGPVVAGRPAGSDDELDDRDDDESGEGARWDDDRDDDSRGDDHDDADDDHDEDDVDSGHDEDDDHDEDPGDELGDD